MIDGQYFKTYKFDNGSLLNVSIKESNGKENSDYKNANIIILLYDITNKKSFEGIKDWIKDAENNGAGFEKILIGNKCDLEGKREVSKDMLDKFGNKKKIKTFETSAKTNINVTDSFDYLAKLIVKDKTKEEIIEKFGERNESINISKKKSENKSKKECCKQ